MSFSITKFTCHPQYKVRACVASNVPISPVGDLKNLTQTNSLCKGMSFLVSSVFATEQIFAKSRYIEVMRQHHGNQLCCKQPCRDKTPNLNTGHISI